jgi:hypothetical protein
MNRHAHTDAMAAAPAAYRLRFTSLFHAGRGMAVPCDSAGQVDMDTLPERLRAAYLGARALVGREYAYPTVEPTQ